MRSTATSDVKIRVMPAAPIEQPCLERCSLTMGGVQKSGELVHLPNLHNSPYLQRYGS